VIRTGTSLSDLLIISNRSAHMRAVVRSSACSRRRWFLTEQPCHSILKRLGRGATVCTAYRRGWGV